MIEDLKVIDDFLPKEELSYWQRLVVEAGRESTSLMEDQVKDTILYRRCKEFVNLPLIHCILFNVKKEHHTELHRDIGEYACIFYPFNHGSATLKLKDKEVEIKENRLVMLNCTTTQHMQKKPDDDSIRYSIALKWRLS